MMPLFDIFYSTEHTLIRRHSPEIELGPACLLQQAQALPSELRSTLPSELRRTL
jgi:hypothetical protein